MASFFLDTRFYVQDFGAFTSPQVETGGSTRIGTQMVLGFIFHILISVSFTCQLFVFSSLLLQHFIYLFFCFGLFVWLSTHLDMDLGEQNITQGRLSCCANPHWLTVTLRPLWPGTARSCTGNWFSINESSLFLMSAVMCSNRRAHGPVHLNMYFSF